MTQRISRRGFVLGAIGAVGAGGALARAQAITAGALVDRITARLGVPYRATGADGLKAGDLTTAVTGIAVAVMPTIDQLRRAIASKHNMIVSLGPTFYAPNDQPGPRAADSIYLAKRELIDGARLVIWRFGEHWSARRPSEASTALADALGWRGALVAGTEQVYGVPETTLAGLEQTVRARLAIRGGLRRVGRADLPVRAVFVSAGTTDVPSTIANLARADVVLAGEPREWEAVPYVLDTAAGGQPRGMIAVGRVISETPGARACAAWLQSVLPEVPVTALPLDDPYWSPAA